MSALIEEVDSDQSGTVDFEEFCLLMQRMKRAPLIPAWLNDVFCPPDDIDEDAIEAVAVLSQPHERGSNGDGEAGPHPPLGKCACAAAPDHRLAAG